MNTKACPSRRAFLAISASATAFLAAPSVIRAQTRSLTIRDLGIGSSFADAYATEFTAETGIEIVPITGANDPIGQIKQMVDTRTYAWDMSIVTEQVADQLAADGDGYLEPLGIEGSAGWKALPEEYRRPYYAGNDVVASVLGYRTDTVDAAPKGWADFFDVENFPGRRALRRSPVETLEFALLADGVAPADLYPLDVERALAKLDTIKDHVAVWWTSGAQTTQLIESGEVDFCPSWNGRIQAAINSGSPAAIMWDQSFWISEGWVVLKGGPKLDLCREFLQFALSPERQAIFSAMTGYGPTLPAAFGHIDPSIAPTMPTWPENRAQAVAMNGSFWTENRDAITERFTAWLLG
ncbi:ABC transporter substrate-binding protein [Stappia sp.]|uniref:ABC transporter substrate-binding protein n=1 Tax=Stappia sp. TaxID=1870903 RepID=UPI003A9A03DE